MNIQENLIDINEFSRPNIKLNSVSYIVIHYTGSNGGRANAIRNYFNRMNGNYASSQYCIDTDGMILRMIPENEVAWHAGNYQMNLNSIGIENCCFDRTNTGSAENGDWYFTDETQNALVELVKDLMARYNIPIEHVIRHYDVTGKYCPAMWVKNESAWNDFKSKLGQVVQQVFQPYKVQVTVNGLRRREQPNTNSNVLGNYNTGDIINIMDQVDNWGNDSNGAWICLDYTKSYSVPATPQNKWYALYRTNATINVHSTPTLNNVIKLYKQGQEFNICEEQNGFGHTPSGWVKLSFCTKE